MCTANQRWQRQMTMRQAAEALHRRVEIKHGRKRNVLQLRSRFQKFAVNRCLRSSFELPIMTWNKCLKTDSQRMNQHLRIIVKPPANPTVADQDLEELDNCEPHTMILSREGTVLAHPDAWSQMALTQRAKAQLQKW